MNQTALQHYNRAISESEFGEIECPFERLKFFCSFAVRGQDWLDSEKFFDDVYNLLEKKKK